MTAPSRSIQSWRALARDPGRSDSPDGRTVVLDAQSYLLDWYVRFGFVRAGADYVDEDGIPHVPMRRTT